ncbi:MAG: Crp/Fnr family transcriptional regulator [Pseudolabrys sp.]
MLYIAGPGETSAEASLFSPTYHCNAVAGTDAVVRVYPKQAVLTAFAKDPKAAQDFSATLARQVMSLRTRLAQRDIRSARERLRHFLRLNVGDDGRTVALSGTLKELAAELGLTHEALYRTLAALERAGEIRRTRGKIVLTRRRAI